MESTPVHQHPLFSAAFRLLGLGLITIPFIALGPIFGDIRDSRGFFTPSGWALGILCTVLGGVLLSILVPGKAWGKLNDRFRRVLQIPRWAFLAIALTILCAEFVFISATVFTHRPLLVDSVVQLFQAQIFATGKAWVALPASPEFFATSNVLFDQGRWYSQYPPGESLLLVPGVWVDAPWLVGILLGLLTALVIYRFGTEAFSESTGRITVILLLLCPFFLFMTPSFMNHVPTLLFLALALLFIVRFERSHKPSDLCWSALWLGCMFDCRPLCALTAGVVLFLWLARSLADRAHARAVVLAIFSGAAAASLFFVYNALTTGSPLLSGYTKLWGAAHGLGFHTSPWGESHTAWMGIGKQLVNLSLLNEHLFESPVPGCFLIGVYLLLSRSFTRWEQRLVGLFLAFPIAYVFYWHRDSYLGPRFLYCCVLPVTILTARAIEQLFTATTSTQSSEPRSLPFEPRRILLSSILLCAGYSIISGIPQRWHLYSNRLASMKPDLANIAAQHTGKAALIFVPVSWGSRILATALGLGVSAPLAEQVYRTSDHCELHETLRTAKAERWDPEQLEASLKLIQQPKNIRRVNTRKDGDPTLRLNPERSLSEACRDEIQYDEGGFSVFLPYLTANKPSLDGETVFATDLRADNASLIQRYPNYAVYYLRDGWLRDS